MCHSLQLAVSPASANSLSRNSEFFVSETYKWFTLSSQRQLFYKSVYEAINDGLTTLKIPAGCKTRWLSIEPAVGRIVSQCLESKTHFGIVRLKEKCYTAEILAEMYRDEENFAFLLFMHPFLEEVQRFNRLFEENTMDKTKLFDDFSLLIQSIANKLIIPRARIDIFHIIFEDYLDSRPYLGFRFERKSEDLKHTNVVTNEEELYLRKFSKVPSALVPATETKATR